MSLLRGAKPRHAEQNWWTEPLQMARPAALQPNKIRKASGLTFFTVPVQVEDGNSGLVLRSNHDLLKHHHREASKSKWNTLRIGNEVYRMI